MDIRQATGRIVTAKKTTTYSGDATGPLGSSDDVSVAPPRGLRAEDHSFLLQMIFELQKSSGQLTQAVTTLTEQVRDQGKKLDSISHRVYGAAAVLGVIGAILYFFLDRMWTKVLAVLQALPQIKP